MSVFKNNNPSSHLALLSTCRKSSHIFTIALLLTIVNSQFLPFIPDGSDKDIGFDTIKQMEDFDRIGREVLGLNVCGTIYTAAGDKVTFTKEESLSQEMFEMIHVEKLKNALFEPNVKGNCSIQVCGFTSYRKRKDDNYIGSDDDYSGCLLVQSNTNATKETFFNDSYNVSSISCGCNYDFKNPCDYSCDVQSVTQILPWSKNECARLYQENACHTCYLDKIQLSNGQNYSTDNYHHILSMIVRDDCEVHFRSPAFKEMYWFKDVAQPVIYKSGPIFEDKVVSAFQSEPEYFQCVCAPEPTPLPKSTTPTKPTPPPSTTPYPVTMPPHKISGGISATLGYALGGVGAFFVVVLIFTGLVIRKKGRVPFLGTRLVNSESQESVMTITETSNTEEPAVFNVNHEQGACVDNDIIPNVPFNMDFETFPELLEVQEVIGQGHFGQVNIGALKVAVKTVKADISSTDRATCIKSLKQEIKILSCLGSHLNLVRFQNAFIGDYMNGEVFLILEFCPGGSLESHLRSTVATRIQEILCRHTLERMRSEKEGDDDDDDYLVNMLNVNSALPNQAMEKNHNLEKLDPETLRQFYKWCFEIVSGMMHVQSKNIVHVDLATRNVLLTSNLVAKVADFGLSKKVYIKNYASNKGDSLPIRWVAPESLKRKKSTSKSDVWSFGVTAWEIFNLGKVPYEDLDCAQVVASIIEGGRLDCPRYATEAVYSKLMDCWSECPDERPTFESLQKYFDCKMHKVLVPI